jgi:hypothetical protein
MPEGKVYPGEINEFRQLEANGWLGDMLAAGEEQLPASRRQDNLAVAASGLPGVADMEQWLELLAQVFDRMGDSLDEY